MNSIWENDIKLPSFPTLKSDTECDVLIIGGGIAGILCAYWLDSVGINYILLESDKICNKTSKLTTAKITSLHGYIYSRLIKEFDKKTARLYYDANEEAVAEYFKLAKKFDFILEPCDSYIYSIFNEKKIINEYNAIKDLDIDCEFTKNCELPFEISGAIKFKNQACFNPLEFISCISKNLNIFEHTHVKKIKQNCAYTDKAKVIAKKIVIATHFPFWDLHGLYFAKMYQEKSYAIAFKSTENLHGMYIDDNSELSIRQYNDYLILGGQKHRTGKKSDGWNGLEELKNKYFPENKIEYKWATEDTITLDGVPYIGKYSAFSKDTFVITGFNKWGMTSSMIGAKLICDLIRGKENRYEKLFSPSRSIIRKQLFVNIYESTTNLLSFSTPRCTHLGCKLVWNSNEHTWDCPCHGSKFSESGEILNGPANKNLKI